MTATDETVVVSDDVFRRFSRQVYRWAYRVLGNHEDALDAVQDVFMKWSRQCAREIPQHPAAWLRSVAIHRAIDMDRRRQSAKGATVLMRRERPIEFAVASKDLDPLDREVVRKRVIWALGYLSELQQAVVVAKVFDELTFAAIATELGLAISTVKTHYLRGIQALRVRLEGGR
ncbi:MAG: sigma-70 family RNA polymerase sigma factor [Planctomycetota bacterium]